MYEYYIRAFPTIFIIDGNGNIYKYAMGAIPSYILEEEITNIIKKSN